MSSIASHTSFFGKRYPIAVIDLQPGMIVEFSYRKDSIGPPTTKKYTVMIVDPKYKRPQDKEYFTHALNLEVANRTAILSLASKAGSTIANSKLQARKVDAEKLIIEGEPRDFYQKNVIRLIEGRGKGSYRTFKTTRLQSIQLINYKFPENIDYYDPSELDENEN